MEKGVHHAIEVAKRLDLPLIIAARVADVDAQYFKQYIKPKLTDKIIWIGEVNEKERNELMSRAMCFLLPVTWPEPFGLTLIESAACGLPVVAFGLGAIPEVVADGITGYVVDSVDHMTAAVKKVAEGAIDRTVCRNYVLEKFSVEQMANGYEAIYRKLLTKKKSEVGTKTSKIYTLPLKQLSTSPRY
jgi:glycosyltransferase involved in cell wall biosynthesis